ncbi:hypothetical protein B296_00043527 [Ensete ventricosum]|uniref:Uncharacterized protein n=1 Tax=Ensete ventricosum TaxID=4639 RepID=A0A426ZE75_ENSVE|nr:hypothetical protein B296_00043527 [Ensete ventricosum]
MSQERSAPDNLRKDVPSATQPTLGGAPQPPLPLPLFGDGNLPSHASGRYWRLFNDPRLMPPPLKLGVLAIAPEAFQPHAAPIAPTGATSLTEGRPLATQPTDNLHQLSPKSDRAPSGDIARHPTSTPSASTHSPLDPDTLSSDSTDSLRA